MVAGHRADVDDVPPVAGDHARQNGASAIQQALDVGVHHALPVVHGTLMGRFQAERQSGVVHQQIHLGEVGGQRSDGGVYRRFVAHVECNSVDRDGRSQFGAQGFQTILAAATDDQMPAVSGELASAGGAETGGDAGDESDLGHG